MEKQVTKLIDSFKELFNGNPWHGDSLMKKLNTIDHKLVNDTPVESTHTIAQILQHLINWRVLAIEKLKGNAAYDIPLNSPADWPKVKINNATEWEKLLTDLGATQDEIIRLMTEYGNEDFFKNKVPGKDYNFRYLLEGIVSHDIYHSGQIGLVYKQLMTGKNKLR